MTDLEGSIDGSPNRLEEPSNLWRLDELFDGLRLRGQWQPSNEK